MKRLILISVIIVLLSFSAASLFYSFVMVENVMIVQMEIEIGNKLGLDFQTDKLNFGRTEPGVNSVTRFIEISNTEDHQVRISIQRKGEMSGWVTVSENNFVLDSGESKKIDFIARPPKDAELGVYQGELRILALRKFF